MQRENIFFKSTIMYLFISVFLVGTAVMAHEWMAPAEEGTRANPIIMEKTSVERGRNIYISDCAACHGENSEGMVPEKTGLQMATPNLKKRLVTHTDGDFFWKIQNGRGEMPSFQDVLSDQEIWDVINYLRSESE